MIIGDYFFLVKIDKIKQKDFREKISGTSVLYMPISSIGNSRNMEHGEVIQIGEQVKDIFPDLCLGDTLLFDWLIEGDDTQTKKSYFVYEDEAYNYYAVDEPSLKGYYDGEKIVPYKSFIFLKNIPAIERGQQDSTIGMRVEKTETGLFKFVEWKDTPHDIALQVADIKKQIDSLAKMTRTQEVQKKITELGIEMNKKNRLLQKKMILPYKVAFSNKIVDRNFGFKIKEDDILYCANWACRYITNFQLAGYSYIIAPIEHIVLLYRPAQKSISKNINAIEYAT